MTTLACWLRERLTAAPQATIADPFREERFPVILSSSEALADGLQAAGMSAGDRIGIMMKNSLAAIHAWFGSVLAGTIDVPVNIAYRGIQFRHILAQSRSAALFCDAEVLPAIIADLAELRDLRLLVVNGSVDPSTSHLLPASLRLVTLDELATGSALVRGTPDKDPSSPTTILYSSGTTGPAKGIVVSDLWCIELGLRSAALLGHGPSDRLYTTLPLFHGNARYNTTLAGLAVGASVVLDERFSASRFWDICASKGITSTNYLGAMMPILWKQPPRPSDRGHTVSRIFGLACPAEIWKPFEERFGVRILEGYGLTETGIALMNNGSDVKIGSCGTVVDDYWIAEVHDASGRHSPAGETGELVLRPKRPGILFNGYFEMAEKTLDTMRDLWFHTGDRVFRDEEGFYFFVDRKTESIRRRGEHVSSWEVEQVLNEHPAILEVAAYGVNSDLAEEEVMVAIVLKQDVTASGPEIARYCEGRMADFAVPKYFRFMQALPKTPTERTEKFKLKAEGVSGDIWVNEEFGGPRRDAQARRARLEAEK